MRRFGRILLNAATVLSLVLCAATVVLWVRSYRVPDVLPWGRGDRLRAVSHEGRIWVDNHPEQEEHFASAFQRGREAERRWFEAMKAAMEKGEPVPEPEEVQEPEPPRPPALYHATSHFVLFGACAILPLIRVAAWKIRQGYDLGLCPACGYDLRATPDRCPECRATPPPPSAAPPAEPARPGGAGG